jgi:ferritin
LILNRFPEILSNITNLEHCICAASEQPNFDYFEWFVDKLPNDVGCVQYIYQKYHWAEYEKDCFDDKILKIQNSQKRKYDEV